MTDLDELIAEADKAYEDIFNVAKRERDLIRRLADALEEVAELHGLCDDRLWGVEKHAERREAERDAATEIARSLAMASTITGADAEAIAGASMKLAALGETEAERDAALARIAELEEALTKECRAFARATVHTAAAMGTMRLTMGEVMVKLGYEGLREELSRAEARIAEAAKLHLSFTAPDGTFCKTCEWVEWPCPTAVSLGLNEGENDE